MKIESDPQFGQPSNHSTSGHDAAVEKSTGFIPVEDTVENNENYKEIQVEERNQLVIPEGLNEAEVRQYVDLVGGYAEKDMGYGEDYRFEIAGLEALSDVYVQRLKRLGLDLFGDIKSQAELLDADGKQVLGKALEQGKINQVGSDLSMLALSWADNDPEVSVLLRRALDHETWNYFRP